MYLNNETYPYTFLIMEHISIHFKQWKIFLYILNDGTYPYTL